MIPTCCLEATKCLHKKNLYYIMVVLGRLGCANRFYGDLRQLIKLRKLRCLPLGDVFIKAIPQTKATRIWRVKRIGLFHCECPRSWTTAAEVRIKRTFILCRGPFLIEISSPGQVITSVVSCGGVHYNGEICIHPKCALKHTDKIHKRHEKNYTNVIF